MKPQYFSAQIVEASTRFIRRVRCSNRDNGATFYRPCPNGVLGQANETLLKEAVRAFYTSPVLSIEILWYDAKLEMLFYRVFNEQDRGHGRTIAHQ